MNWDTPHQSVSSLNSHSNSAARGIGSISHTSTHACCPSCFECRALFASPCVFEGPPIKTFVKVIIFPLSAAKLASLWFRTPPPDPSSCPQQAAPGAPLGSLNEQAGQGTLGRRPIPWHLGLSKDFTRAKKKLPTSSPNKHGRGLCDNAWASRARGGPARLGRLRSRRPCGGPLRGIYPRYVQGTRHIWVTPRPVP